MSQMVRFGTLVLVAASAACASKSPSTAGSAELPSRPASTRRERDVISYEEIQDPAVRSRSVYEVVKVLRPQYFNDRGSHGIPYSGSGGTDADKARLAVDPGQGRVHASIDAGKIISVDELKNMHANSVLEIRFLSPAQAMQKFGGAALEGPVILVKTAP
jgi:hypothetical protein